MERTVVALYDNLETAQSAVQELLSNGFSRDDISVVRTNQQGDYTSGNVNDPNSMSSDAGGAVAGAGIGAVLGGLAGLLVGLGALAIPGIGPIIAAGPLATTLAGAGLGAATGGLVGALADAGIPKSDAGAYAEGVRRGGTLVTVRADEDMVSRATEIMNRYTPVDINQRTSEWRGAGWSGFDANAGPYSTTTGAPHTGQYGGEGSDAGASDMRGQAGSSDYRTHQGMMGENSGGTYEGTGSAGYTGSGTIYPNAGSTVHPRSSEGDYQARRDFLGGDASMDEGIDSSGGRSSASRMIETGQGSYGAQGQDFERTPTESSEGHAMEGQLGGHQGALAGGGTIRGGSRFEDYDPDFRTDWETNYRDTGFGYERFQPAYQYGWQLGSRYTGRDWSEFESDVRTEWEQRHPNDAWRDFKAAVRSGWERFRTNAQEMGQEMRGAARELGHDQGQGLTRSYDAYDRDFRSDWEKAYRATGCGYERYQPAYQYGYTAGSEPRYRGRRWEEVEADFRRDWEQRHPNDAWDDFKDAVRHAWQRVRTDVRDATD
jgi:hypothetical protein